VIEFTGERVIPGQVDPDLWAEHISRYAFASRFAPEALVLDVGCGAGYGTAELASRARFAIGIDLAPEAITHATSTYTLPNIRFVPGSALALPFANESFELVTAFEVIEHLTDWRSLLSEAKRLLHQVDRRTPIEAVARVRMAQPVSRDLGREPGPFGCGFHDPVHGALIQGTPTLAGAEHRSVRSRTKRAATWPLDASHRRPGACDFQATSIPGRSEVPARELQRHACGDTRAQCSSSEARQSGCRSVGLHGCPAGPSWLAQGEDERRARPPPPRTGARRRAGGQPSIRHRPGARGGLVRGGP